MKQLLFLLSLFISLSLSAQNKFHFGAVVSPVISGNILSNDGTVPGTVAETFRGLEKTVFGYTGYMFTQYKINEKWSILTGAGYAHTGYTTGKHSNLVFAQPEPSAIQSVRFSWIHQDIILPVLSRYNLTKRKNKFYVIGGLTPLLKLGRIKKQESGYLDGSSITKKEEDTVADYRKINLNGTIGIGYDLQLASKTSLFFQPTFDCNLLDTAKSGSLNRKIYAIGLNIGVRID